jgi:hypothetical protein
VGVAFVKVGAGGLFPIEDDDAFESKVMLNVVHHLCTRQDTGRVPDPDIKRFRPFDCVGITT